MYLLVTMLANTMNAVDSDVFDTFITQCTTAQNGND